MNEICGQKELRESVAACQVAQYPQEKATASYGPVAG